MKYLFFSWLIMFSYTVAMEYEGEAGAVRGAEAELLSELFLEGRE